MAQVGKIGQLDLGNLVSPAGRSLAAKDSAFSSIMSSNMKNTSGDSHANSHTDGTQTAKAKFEEGSACSKKIEQSNTKNVTKNVQEKTNEAQSVDTDNAAYGEVQDSVVEAADALKEKLAKILDITEEELEKLMAESGIGFMDLFQPEVLQQLVLQVNDSSELTDLLTNEAMCSQLQELLETVEEFALSVDVEQFEATAEQDFSKVLEEESDIEQPVDKAPVKEQEQVITVQKEVATTDEKNEENKGSSSKDSDNSSATFNQFVQNLSESIVSNGEITVENVEKMQQMQEIVNQVVERIKVTLTNDTTSMEMQLNPENLGKVNVSIVSKNGEMTAAFTVENQIAKEALESQMTTLKDNLQEQGIKVDAIEVTVAQQGLSQDEFSHQNQQQFQNQKKQNSSSSRIRLRGEDSLEEEPEDEAVQTVNSNGTVDFSA